MPPTIILLLLVTTAGLVAVVLLWPRVRSQPTGARVAVSALKLFTLLYGLLAAAQRLPR